MPDDPLFGERIAIQKRQEHAVLGVYHEWLVTGRCTTSGQRRRFESIPECAVVAELYGEDFDVRTAADRLHKKGLLASARPNSLALVRYVRTRPVTATQGRLATLVSEAAPFRHGLGRTE